MPVQENNQADWERVAAIFEAALALDAPQRAGFLAEACGGDPDLRAEVESLLEADGAAADFIETPAAAGASASLFPPAATAFFAESFAARRVGVYELQRELGRGGMGAVYLAARADGEFAQTVAIKLMRRHLAGPSAVRRFRRERQILANLEHPHIARLIDGGTTGAGAPYLVMEYVAGENLLVYARGRGLDLPRKIALFADVCRAVAYAHGRGVLHRDLKPANILVTEEGRPKLLDFGIARLDDEESDEATELTMTGRWLMTPEYASPEQIRGEELTPATDVYSLGVVLYELATGARPYCFPSRAPHEISRVVCEAEPARLAESLNFGREARGERLDALDRIVSKALRKSAAERYPTAAALAADVELYLKGEPVGAPPVEGGLVSGTVKTSAVERGLRQALLIASLALPVVALVALLDSKSAAVDVSGLVFMLFFSVAVVRAAYGFYRGVDERRATAGAITRSGEGVTVSWSLIAKIVVAVAAALAVVLLYVIAENT